jgi:two-component system, NarL family, nitrate/nitrite sensor histidine kinase NarX
MAIGTSIEPTIAIEGTPRSVKPDLGMHLLRIAQESLNNALRHAQASAIEVRLTYLPKHLEITISDNGRGFEPDRLSRGFGIKGMRQRAELIGADFQIDTQADRGTQIRLTIALT